MQTQDAGQWSIQSIVKMGKEGALLSKIPTQTLLPLQHPFLPRLPTWTPILLFMLRAAPNTACLPSRPNRSDPFLSSEGSTCKGALGHD